MQFNHIHTIQEKFRLIGKKKTILISFFLLLLFLNIYYRDTLGDDVSIQVSTEPAKELSKSRKQIEESFQVCFFLNFIYQVKNNLISLRKYFFSQG